MPLPFELTFSTKVNHRFFLKDGHNSSVSSRVNCEVIGFSFYPGEVITATVLLENGSLFQHVPLTQFGTENPATLESHSFCNTPTTGVDMEISQYDYLIGTMTRVRFPPDTIRELEYQFSLDDKLGNLSLNIMTNKVTRQIFAVPNFRINFNNNTPLDSAIYKKLPATWRL